MMRQPEHIRSYASAGRRQRALLAAASATLALGSVAFAGGGTWTKSTGGAWGTGSNWSSGAAPTAVDNVTFNLNSTYIVAVGAASVANNINLTAGNVMFSLGANTLTSANGMLNVAGVAGQTGSLTFLGGNTSIGGAGLSLIGNGAASNGTLILNNATLSTSQSPVIGMTNGQGTMIVDTLARLNSASWTVVGYQTGSGNLLIQNGGDVISAVNNVVGWSGGTGTARVSGTDSNFNATSGYLDVGDSGQGTLIIEDTGKAFAGSLVVVGYASGTGTALVQTGGELRSASSTAIGWNGGVGRVTVTDANSKLLVQGGILDIGEGGTGTLTVQNGGQAIVSGDAYLGLTGGTGRIIATGNNSSLSISGSAHIGNGSSGTLALSNNAAASIASTLKVYSGGRLTLDSGASLSVGTLDLSGDANRFTWNGGTLKINNSALAADGVLTVPGGGTLTGAGTIGRTVVVSPNGTIAPGSSPGKLSFTNNLTLQTSGSDHAVVDVELGGDPTLPINFGNTFDVISLSGAGKVFTVGGATLRVTPLLNAMVNKAYQIVQLSGGATVNFSSMFSNLVNGTTYSTGQVAYTVSYDTNQGIFVTFTRVPEPTSLGMLSLMSLPLLRRRRRSR